MRIGIYIDGFNPILYFRSPYCVYQGFIIYNIPPWVYKKSKFISYLVTQYRQNLAEEIEVFLRFLIDKLIIFYDRRVLCPSMHQRKKCS